MKPTIICDYKKKGQENLLPGRVILLGNSLPLSETTLRGRGGLLGNRVSGSKALLK
jgi:hypothetical protein